MKSNIIYSGSPVEDFANIARFIDEFYETSGVSPAFIDTDALKSTTELMYKNFPWNDGWKLASPFKKVAAFTCHFCSLQPCKTPLSNAFEEVKGFQNPIIAYSLSVKALHNAVIDIKHSGPQTNSIRLSNKIKISKHYFSDLMLALDTCDINRFKFISLIYESLAYEANPNASYQRIL